MIPWAREKTAPVSNKLPPQTRKAARTILVRGRRKPNRSDAPSRMSAPGSSHETWPPNWLLNRRFQPVNPQREPRAPKPPILPDSLPVSRPKPLYPKIKLIKSLF